MQLLNRTLLKKINFNYTLIGFSSDEIDPELLRKVVWGNVNDTACKNDATKYLIDLGVIYNYIYRGNDNRLITNVELDEYICK